MPFPRWLARSNKYVANRMLISLAARPPFGAIRHTGRTTGNEYRIPINAFRNGNDFVIALTYGTQADWVTNVLASGRATIEHGGIDHAVSNPRIVGRSDALGVFPAWAVAILRLVAVTEFLRLEVET